MSRVEVVHRRRFVPLPSAVVERLPGGAVEVRIPVGDPIHQTTRRAPTPEGWDGAIFAVDGEEGEPAVGSGIRKGHVVVVVLMLG